MTEHPNPCGDCGSREFVKVWGLYDEHEQAPDGEATLLAPTGFECQNCGHEQNVREEPR